MAAGIYFGNGASVLGPYTDAEIQPQLRAKRHLGGPEGKIPVYRTRATSPHEAREQIASAIRRGRV